MPIQPEKRPPGEQPAGNWYRTLFETMPDPVFCMEPDGTIIDVNPAGLERFSRYRDPVIGSNFYELMAAHPELAKLLPGRMQLDREVVRTCTGRSFEDEQDGHVIRHIVFPLESSEGQVTRLCVIDQDITLQKRAEHRSRELQQWGFTLEQCRLGAWSLDMLEGTLKHTREHDRIFGYDDIVPEWNYELFREHIVPQDRAELDRLFDEAKTGRNGWDAEFRIRTVQGELRWIRNVGAVVRDEDGRAVTLLGVIQDITERKQAEVERQDFQAKMAYALENSHVSFWTLDLKRNTVLRTREHDRIFGYDDLLPEWTVESFFHHLHPEDRAMVGSAYREAMADRKDFRLECRIIRADGVTAWIALVGTFNFGDSPDGRYVVGIVQDITERKEAELATANLQQQLQQFQKLDMVGQLAGGIAHDFNNVLAAILGNAEMMLREIGPGHPFHGNLESIRSSVKRSAGMVSQLLAFARKQVWSPRIINPDDELHDILDMLRKLIRENIELRLEPGCGGATVRLDPSQLVQIVTNLCINSRDAIPEEGVITIRTGLVGSGACEGLAASLQKEDRPMVMISVSDTGSGIAQEELPHVFEPFYTTKEVGKGTGLGLAVVYGIVKQNAGFIECRSEPGKGTTFNLLFPAVQPQEAERQGHRAQEAARRRFFDVVLLVEDEPDIMNIIRTILEDQGLRVLTAGNAEEAIDLFRANADKITVVISDVVLPGINGIQMSRVMRQENPRLKFVFMSAYSAETVAQAGLDTGNVDFLSKPFSIRELLWVITPLLSQEPESPSIHDPQGVRTPWS